MPRGKLFRFKFSIDKRKKFVLATAFLAFGLLISQFLHGGERIAVSFLLALLSATFLYFIIRRDIEGSFVRPFFLVLLILPFFYTLSLGLFYFLVPERFLTRIAVTGFFTVTSYALFLAHNIYAVSSIRTIQLLRAAHAVSFFLTIIAFFILLNIIFTLHLAPYFLFFLVFLSSFPLVVQILWGVTLENRISQFAFFLSLGLSLILAQIATMLSFWPVLPTVAAIFLSGNFYTFLGLSQYWLERRLFRGILWEYIWVIVIVFLVLLVTTNWEGS